MLVCFFCCVVSCVFDLGGQSCAPRVACVFAFSSGSRRDRDFAFAQKHLFLLLRLALASGSWTKIALSYFASFRKTARRAKMAFPDFGNLPGPPAVAAPRPGRLGAPLAQARPGATCTGQKRSFQTCLSFFNSRFWPQNTFDEIDMLRCKKIIRSAALLQKKLYPQKSFGRIKKWVLIKFIQDSQPATRIQLKLAK